MILDKKLQLASNLNIGNAARTKAGTRISDLLPMDGLGSIGNGEQLYCCVTVTQSFSASTGLSSSPSPQASLFSFRLHHTYDFDPVAFEAGVDNAVSVMYAHRMQPLLGQTGFIPNNYGNLNAGKKFIFPISPISHKTRLITGQPQSIIGTGIIVGPSPVPGLATWDPGNPLTYLYAVVEETATDGPTIVSSGLGGLGFPASAYPVNQTVSGRVDIDIVTIADAGAGPTFNDVRHYPTGTIVR
jgi:hypothetical protein